MDETPNTLVAVCQVSGLVAAGLLLPAALIDQAFGTGFLDILLQAAMVAFAIALMVAAWSAHQQK